ncbi:protein kinase [Nocardia yamanashiensis]|uniref:serine/threonine-protein kinase n=1 Tax=Nocardia yamanashiensis TaxID=209247 RepID=UPI001E2B651A|nr:serine/threonine-protein kinase [Nocardia yamanashiensis]UGT42669.1 protein kinase [Nocardia yamanashiensis]
MGLQPGTVFAGFSIERLLGAGGMGTVYLAAHPRLRRRVALKVLGDTFVTDTKIRTAFDREATLAAGLDHPNIVPVYDRSAVDDAALWLAMRYIDGGDAAALLREHEQGLEPARAVRLVADAAHALDYAHAQGVLHRDVKPANLLIDNDHREGERAVLTDFGIARTLDDTVTLSGIAATFAYAAPERFSDTPADHRADIYSLGCTLFQLLTGQPPFPRKDQAAVIGAHLTAPPPAPRTVRPELPAALDDVIATALAKSPADRYPTCTALAAAAAAALPPVVAPGPTGPERTVVIARAVRPAPDRPVMDSRSAGAELERPVVDSRSAGAELKRPVMDSPGAEAGQELPEAVSRTGGAKPELPVAVSPGDSRAPGQQFVGPGGVRPEPTTEVRHVESVVPVGSRVDLGQAPAEIIAVSEGAPPVRRRRLATVSGLVLAGVSVVVAAAFALRDDSGSPASTPNPPSVSVTVSQQLTTVTSVPRTSEPAPPPPPADTPPAETESAITAAPPAEQAPQITVQRQPTQVAEAPVVPQTRSHQWPG